jgi:hypothetical protein
MGKEYPDYFTFEVEETAINTYTEEEIEVPVDHHSMYIIEIVGIQYRRTRPELVEGVVAYSQFQLCRKTQAGVRFPNEETLIYGDEQQVEAKLTTEGGELLYADNLAVYKDMRIDGKGRLYPWGSIFAGIKGTGNPANKMSVKGRIWYNIVKVDAKELIELLRSD